MGFLSLERITGECIGQTILKFHEEKGINIFDNRGQAGHACDITKKEYFLINLGQLEDETPLNPDDGATNMQSLEKGGASYILKEFPIAYTIHCCLHSLSFSLVSTCKIPIFTKVADIYKSVLI